MEYWNFTHTSRNNRGLSLGTQHRIFESQYKKHRQDAESIKETQSESSPTETESTATEEQDNKEESSETVDERQTTPSPVAESHSTSIDSSMERGGDETSDRSEHEHVETKQENEQDSNGSEVRDNGGEERTEE